MAIDGPALRILREKDGYSATAFAERLGISLTYLGDIESGRRTLERNPDLIGKAAEVLNVPRSMIEATGQRI
jgi:transcriptional regulator with XRE-family HTH domain